MAPLKEKLLSYTKVVAINIVITVVLLALINWTCGAILRSAAGPSRAELPNYNDERELARKIFSDYNSIKHRYEPFSEWRALPYKGETTNVDENGFRIVPGTPASGPVVKFFGGSTLWGEGADDARTIPAYFQSLHPDMKVYNRGQLAYNSMQNLVSLASQISKGDSADIVIFYDGVNDAAFLCPTEINVPGHRLVPSFQKRIYGSSSTFILTFLDNIFLSNIRRLIVRSQGKTPGASAYNCAGNQEKIDAIADGMLRNWEMAHTLVTSKGKKFFAVLQPAAYVGTPRTDHLELDEELGRNMKAVYDAFRARLAEKNYPWAVDLTARFDSNEYIYVDFCHVSPAGNKIIAESISEFLGAQLTGS